MVVSILWISPTAWRGWYECIAALEIFVFIWVLTNNVRTRAHLWALIVMALSPAAYAIFIGFYQFFQNPSKLANSWADFGLQLSPDFLGQATGSFADPSSFAAFLLILLPSLLIAGLVPRLPMILRVLCLYIALMFLAAICFTLMFWPAVLIFPIMLVVPLLCFQKRLRRVKYTGIGSLIVLLVVLGFVFYYPPFKQDLMAALSTEGEGVRIVLWEEAARIALDEPIFGAGAGSFALKFEQSPRLSLPVGPTTPHNDYLLMLSEYGLVGGLLLLVPVGWVLIRSYRSWRAEPYRARLQGGAGTIMPPRKFFLGIGLAGVASFVLCLFCTFVIYVPALALYGALFFVILIKSSFSRGLRIPRHWSFRWGYLVLGLVLGGALYTFSAPRIQAQALELKARQRLDQIVAQRVHVSGNPALLDRVLEDYRLATELDPENADAWIGLSAANCQLFFRNPANYEAIGEISSAAAQQAIDLSESYWLGWAQLGISESLRGNLAEAEAALAKALVLAPNSSNAHYYWAAYMSNFPEKAAVAIAAIERALEINPNNTAARRLQQKLLIL
jgi:O-antigen ligase